LTKNCTCQKIKTTEGDLEVAQIIPVPAYPNTPGISAVIWTCDCSWSHL